MLRPGPSLRWVAVVVSALAAAGVLGAGPKDLVGNSPFVPPGTAAGPAAGDGGTLELRSIMVLGGAPQFSIFDSATKPKRGGTWVGLNDRSQEFVVKSYDASADTVNVEYRGRALTLALQKAKIAAAPIAAIGAAPVASLPTLPPPPALVNTVRTNPTPAEEAQRLQAVVEEIRRRREQRTQTGPVMPGQLPGQVPQIQPPPQQFQGRGPGQQQQQQGGPRPSQGQGSTRRGGT